MDRTPLLVALVVTLACGDDSLGADSGSQPDSASGPDPIPMGMCSSYNTQCPADGIDEVMCAADCETSPTPNFDDCGFWACGVEVSLCDNEVSGDPEILACMQRHGWLEE